MSLVRCIRIVLLGVTPVLSLGCRAGSDAPAAESYADVLGFDTATIRLVTRRDTTRLTVELAESEAQRTMGLMERRHLASDAGMLFLYSAVQPESSAFWMFRTRIPLDIAFLDHAGVIRTIRTMEPCTSTLAQGCPTYAAGAPYRAALEVNAGYFARHHIAVGDRVLMADTAARRRTARPPRQ